MTDETKKADQRPVDCSDQRKLSGRRRMLLAGTAIATIGALGTSARIGRAQAQTPMGGRKPNILVIFGDDVGITNISAYSGGLMGYETPEHRPPRARGHQVPALLR